MSLSNKQWQFLKDVSTLIDYADALGVKLTGGNLARSNAQQLLNYHGKDLIFKNGELQLIDAPKVSWSMDSDHLNKMAIDFNFFINGKYIRVDAEKEDLIIKLGAFWESLNPKNYWGGFWKKTPDAPHFGRKL